MRIAATAGYIVILGLLAPDPIRKLLPQYRDSALVLVDVSLVIVYGLILMSPGVRPSRWRVHPLFAFSSFAIVLWVLTNMILVDAGVSYRLAGLHSYVVFVPLGFCLARIFQHVDSRAEGAICRVILWLGIVISLTGFASLLKAGTVFAPINVETSEHTYGYGRVFLASGIFATGERLARTLLIPFIVALAQLSLRAGNRRLAVATIVISGTGILASARRYPIGLAVLAVVGIVLFGGRHLRSAARLVLALAFLLTLTIILAAPTQFGGFLSQGVTEVPDRVRFALTLSPSTPLGQGAGTSSQGIRAPEADLRQAEGGLDRWLLELGPLGLLLGLLWGLAVSVAARRSFMESFRCQSPLRLAASLFVLLQLLWYLKVHSTFGDPYSLFQFWLCIGVLQTKAQAIGSNSARPPSSHC